jgi:hypothetical protein
MLQRAFWLFRWWATEFLALPAPRDPVSSLTALCRLSGCATMLALVRFGLDAPVATDTTTAAVRWVLLLLIATLLGNLAKELAFVVCADIMNWCGQPFFRGSHTVDGRQVREAHLPDGTWIRYESGRGASVCEWTEASGACKRITIVARGLRSQCVSPRPAGRPYNIFS